MDSGSTSQSLEHLEGSDAIISNLNPPGSSKWSNANRIAVQSLPFFSAYHGRISNFYELKFSRILLTSEIEILDGQFRCRPSNVCIGHYESIQTFAD